MSDLGRFKFIISCLPTQSESTDRQVTMSSPCDEDSNQETKPTTFPSCKAKPHTSRILTLPVTISALIALLGISYLAYPSLSPSSQPNTRQSRHQ